MSMELSEEEIRSRAEAMFAMDVVMRHLSQEEDRYLWLLDGDFEHAPRSCITDEQLDFYRRLSGSFESIVERFARIVRDVCFTTRTTYDPRSFC